MFLYTCFITQKGLTTCIALYLLTRYLKANTGDLRELTNLLGHASLNTVMIYTEPDSDDLEERMEQVEAGGKAGLTYTLEILGSKEINGER